MRILHGELVAMQEWVKDSGAKICIVFEGRDTAGKGGTIKRITERVSPRVFRVVALPTPTEREKTQMYVQRYIPHFPAAGEVVIFDRSWYNRAGVERVMGFCKPEETERFLELTPGVEKAMIDDGILLLKYWLEVSPEEQTRRWKAGSTTAAELLRDGVELSGRNISYTFTGLNKLKPAMIGEANKNARDSAEQFARDSGAAVGRIKTASQGYFSVGARDGEDCEDCSSSGGSTPFQKVRVVTTIDYDLG